MRTPPRLSIITVCYNAEGTIAKTIRSVAEQTFTDYEYIIVDGQSTDGTLRIVEENRDGRFVVISEQDRGLYDAMNKGVQMARGDFVYFLNAGDYLVNEFVMELVFRRIDLHAQHDLYYGGLLLYDRSTGRGRIKRQFAFVNMVRLFKRTLPHQATLVRRSLFSTVGLFDVSLHICSDYDWFMRAIIRHKVRYKYIEILVAVFDCSGISSRGENYSMHKKERRTVQLRYMSKVQYALLNIGLLHSVLMLLNSVFYEVRRVCLGSEDIPSHHR